MCSAATYLNGVRVLVVEDTLLVAELIAEILTEGGAIVVGPFSRVEGALGAAQAEALDGALLDMNVAGRPSFPIAEALTLRGIPFIFITGYIDASLMPPALRGVPRIAKPFKNGELTAACGARFQPAH